jgi:hypothetical protein
MTDPIAKTSDPKPTSVRLTLGYLTLSGGKLKELGDVFSHPTTKLRIQTIHAPRRPTSLYISPPDVEIAANSGLTRNPATFESPNFSRAMARASFLAPQA